MRNKHAKSRETLEKVRTETRGAAIHLPGGSRRASAGRSVPISSLPRRRLRRCALTGARFVLDAFASGDVQRLAREKRRKEGTKKERNWTSSAALDAKKTNSLEFPSRKNIRHTFFFLF